jgi:hypothetical protein
MGVAVHETGDRSFLMHCGDGGHLIYFFLVLGIKNPKKNAGLKYA